MRKFWNERNPLAVSPKLLEEDRGQEELAGVLFFSLVFFR